MQPWSEQKALGKLGVAHRGGGKTGLESEMSQHRRAANVAAARRGGGGYKDTSGERAEEEEMRAEARVSHCTRPLKHFQIAS